MTGKIRAWIRIVGIVLLLVWLLSGLLLRTLFSGSNQKRGFRYRRKYTSGSLRILGVKVRYKGKPSSVPVLYVCNHRSMLDPFINLKIIDAYIVSKAEVARYPLVGRGARETGVIFVDRGDKDSRSTARESIRRALLEDKSVLIYPEGTTSNVDTTQEFKPGSFNVAAEEGIPVVPVAIEYARVEHKWNDGGLLPFFVRKFSAKKIHAGMHIGDAVISGDPKELKAKAQLWINEEILKIRSELIND